MKNYEISFSSRFSVKFAIFPLKSDEFAGISQNFRQIQKREISIFISTFQSSP